MTTATPAPVSEARLATAVRFLAADAIEKANSGHPGMPLGMADVATVLFSRFLKFDPQDPQWPDRDRFVLSAGHGSMLLYALLHLAGYAGVDIEQIKAFRQFGARTAGHPEYRHLPGVETTTGPLGQGIATAVGIALAERMMNARFSDAAVDHYTYVICGDGCLMEGISQEAISLAGHLKLAKMIVLWDDNGISIDGATSLATSEDQLARFEAAGWDAVRVDGHDAEAIAAAIAAARESARPSLIACRTVIGKGAPNKAGSHKIHGAPLGADEIAAARAALGWSYAPFEVPEDVRDAWQLIGIRGSALHAAWEARMSFLPEEKYAEFQRLSEGRMPDGWSAALVAHKQALAEAKPKIATRKASQDVLGVLTKAIPELVGGSADLTGSNLTRGAGQPEIAPGDYAGTYIHFGIREHGMAAAMNGLALGGPFIPYGGTFLVFTDYLRPALRLAALMGLRVVYVMTHDSIGLGEDGPTHQPVEHLASLRAMPNLLVMRPADAVETAECWAAALEQTNRPSVLALSRQNLPTLRTAHTVENLCAKGGYVIAEAPGPRAATLIATGSEVALAVEAAKALNAEGIATAVVSLPCWELFDAQPEGYRAAVLGGSGVRVAIEAGVGMGWERYVGDGPIVAMPGFGASAPADKLFEHFGFTVDNVVRTVKTRLG
ncbi:transketolase [Oleispirillum naphthae]|uniref:transketolase n=1 Tax=Oleispirillum naphthae TaxID=2838853 RepID=UPI00308242E3